MICLPHDLPFPAAPGWSVQASPAGDRDFLVGNFVRGCPQDYTDVRWNLFRASPHLVAPVARPKGPNEAQRGYDWTGQLNADPNGQVCVHVDMGRRKRGAPGPDYWEPALSEPAERDHALFPLTGFGPGNDMIPQWFGFDVGVRDVAVMDRQPGATFKRAVFTLDGSPRAAAISNDGSLLLAVTETQFVFFDLN